MNNQEHAKGFTLVELMVTLTISAILLGIAVPSFKSYITRNAIENLQS
ncbi:MAG: prepilin-type N-terminal cleavage/methylation domain-containing protein, partial [Moraxellaceae bacterium]